MSCDLQQTHDDVLSVFLKYRKKEAHLEDFKAAVSETGFIDAFEGLFQESLRPDPDARAAQPLKLHATMVQFVFREMNSPRLYVTPRYDEPFPQEFTELGLRTAAFEPLMGGADTAPRLVVFVKNLLKTGRLNVPSPFSDQMLSTDRGLIFYLGGKPYIFYIAQAGEPVVMIVNPNMGNIIACYLPSRNIVVGQAINYDRIIAHLKLQCVKHWDLLQAYLTNPQSNTPVLISSFMQHAGHTLLNELTGFDCALRDVSGTQDMPVLLGPHEYVDTRALFSEIPSERFIIVDPLQTDLFEYSLKHSFLPVRPTMRHYRIVQEFRARIDRLVGREEREKPKSLWERVTSRTKKTTRQQDGLDLSGISGRTPVIWIEVRSNHRIWLNQIEGIKVLIGKLKHSHPGAAIFLAGWSRPPNPSKEDTKQINADLMIHDVIAEYAQSDMPVICGIGLTSEEKLRWAYECHACITTFGSGMTAPCLIANLPSVIHSNLHYTDAPAMDPDLDKRHVFADKLTPYEVVGAQYITDDPDTSRFQVRGHFVSGDVIYDHLCRALERSAERPT